MKMAMIATPPFRRAQVSIRQLYEGSSDRAHRFRYTLLAFDLVTLLFIVATSFVPGNAVIETLDVVFGLVILADFGARLLISHHRLRDLLRPTTLADIAAIVSFLAPLVGEGAGFLRILRTAWGRRDAGGRGANLQCGRHHHWEAAAEPFRWRKRRRVAHK